MTRPTKTRDGRSDWPLLLWPRRGIVGDFMRGLCIHQLARKHGRTVAQVEAAIRRGMR